MEASVRGAAICFAERERGVEAMAALRRTRPFVNIFDRDDQGIYEATHEALIVAAVGLLNEFERIATVAQNIGDHIRESVDSDTFSNLPHIMSEVRLLASYFACEPSVHLLPARSEDIEAILAHSFMLLALLTDAKRRDNRFDSSEAEKNGQ